MEGASAMTVTPAGLDVSGGPRVPARRRAGEHRTRDLRTTEHCLELVASPLADTAPAQGLEVVAEAIEHAEVVEDVRPASRHEALCRGVNVTIAALALIALSPV